MATQTARHSPTAPPTAAEVAAAHASPAGLAWIAGGRGRAWTPARHLLILARELVTAATVPDYRGTVEMPPRHGKSELTSHYNPAWFLGRWPHRRVILASYEATFAASWGEKARDTLTAWGPALYGVRVRPDHDARADWRTERYDRKLGTWVDAGGGMVTAGAGGAITGRGGDLVIVDDPIKNWQEANSETRRRTLVDWLRSTVLTRLEPGGSVLLVMTRWHEQDPVGVVTRPDREHDTDRPDLEDEPEPPWERVRMAALAEDLEQLPERERLPDPLGRAPGEALWPDRYPARRLRAIRRRVGPRVWAGLYQQRPAPAEGGMFARSDLRYWRQRGEVLELLRPDAEPLRVHRRQLRTFATMDLAISERTNADWTVLAVWGITGDGALVLLDRWRERIDSSKHAAMVKTARARHPGVAFVGIEATQYQATVVKQLRRERVPAKPLYPDKDKVTRAMLAETLVVGHDLYLPADAPWLHEFEDELTLFPNGRHDDQVDVLAYAALELYGHADSTLHASH